MADHIIATGRKFFVVKWLIGIFFYLSAAIIALSIMDREIPQALGLALSVDIGGVVGYIGVNAWQKKVQSGNVSEIHVTPVGG